jgi:transposase
MANLEKKVIGVDVGSKMLVMSLLDEEGKQSILYVGNNKEDIVRNFKKIDSEKFKIVVEATGAYSSKILYYTYSLGFEVYQVSGLSVKKFSEAKNQISKTDEQDAILIRNFGETMDILPFEPKKESIEFLEQELNLWKDLEQEKARFSLKLKSLHQKPILNKEVVKHYESILKRIGRDIEKLQKRLPNLEDAELKQNKDLLTSISGIGEKTARLLLVATNNFKNFKSAKAVSKYFGVAPRLYHSGNKKVTIGKCKTTKGFVRSILYICSWSAIRYNAQCKALFERITDKGKCKMIALIAVCNKLLRQAFGIINNKQQYQSNYIYK